MKRFSFIVFAILSSPILTFAQDSIPPDAGIKAGNGEAEKMSMFDFLLKGGYFLIPILLLLFYTIFRIVERYLYIKRMTKYDKSVLSSVKNCLDKGDIQGALNVVQDEENSYCAVIEEGIQTVSRPFVEIESNMEKVVHIELGKMEKGLGHLGLIAGIAPTFGFIGTIAGVIKIFYQISISENVSIGNISGGLYEKMISSGMGLLVGLIAYSGYHLLNTMVDGYVNRIHEVNLGFVNIINRPSK